MMPAGRINPRSAINHPAPARRRRRQSILPRRLAPSENPDTQNAALRQGRCKIPLQVFYTGPDVKLHFAYPGFHWVPVFSAGWIDACVGVLALGGLLLTLGLFCRLASLMVFLSWGYLYAIESTRTYWMSYHYLELLSSFLLI